MVFSGSCCELLCLRNTNKLKMIVGKEWLADHAGQLVIVNKYYNQARSLTKRLAFMMKKFKFFSDSHQPALVLNFSKRYSCSESTLLIPFLKSYPILL